MGGTALESIDSLTDGFSRVAKRLWLAVIPVLLDLFLWRGPKISIRPVVVRMVELLKQTTDMVAAEAIPDVGTSEMFGAMIDMLQNTLGKTNLFALLAWSQLGVPSIAGIVPVDEAGAWVFQITDYGVMLLLQLLIMGLGLLIAAGFLALLAQELREETRDLRRMVRDTLVYWIYLGAIVVPLGLFMLLSLSFSLLLGPLSIFVGVLLLWIMLYMAFVPQAVTLFDLNPIRAVLTSFTVVRTSFWPAIGFLLLVNVINRGLGLLWARLMTSSSVGALVAMAGNAYVGTSLTLAMFIFVHRRLATYREMLAKRSA